MNHLDDLFVASVTVTIVLTTFNLGLLLGIEQVSTQLRRVGLMCLVGGANVVVMPAVAWLATEMLPLETPERVGVTLVATGAGGALGLKAVQISRSGDLALALVLVLVLELLNLLAMPIWTLSIVGDSRVGAVRLVVNLVGVVVLPAALGLVLRVRTHRWAELAAPWIARMATVTLVVALVAGVASISRPSDLVTSYVPVAALLITVVGLALGAVVGRRQENTAQVTASMVTGTRFGALGLLVIATAFPDDPRYEDAGLVAALVTMITVVVFSMFLRFQYDSRRRTLFEIPATENG